MRCYIRDESAVQQSRTCVIQKLTAELLIKFWTATLKATDNVPCDRMASIFFLVQFAADAKLKVECVKFDAFKTEVRNFIAKCIEFSVSVLNILNSYKRSLAE